MNPDAKSMGFMQTNTVQCFPLYSILHALRVYHINYLSLDIEGAELDVLKFLPWRLIIIDVISIEYKVGTGKSHSLKKKTQHKLQQIRNFFKSLKVYREVAILPNGNEADGIDVIFARTDVINKNRMESQEINNK